MKRQKIALAQKRFEKLCDMESDLFEIGSDLTNMGESTKRIDYQFRWIRRRQNKMIKKYGWRHLIINTYPELFQVYLPDPTDVEEIKYC